MSELTEKEFPTVEKVLRLLAGGIFLTTLFIQPHLALGIASTYMQFYNWKRFPKNKLRRTLDRLRKRKFVRLVEQNNETFIELTEFGRREILHFDFQKLEIKKPLKWDGKWWMVIFDIPNIKKSSRDNLRKKLKELDFYFIQESVCIHPYMCQKEIEFLREYFHIKQFVDLVKIDYFEKEYLVRRYFNL